MKKHGFDPFPALYQHLAVFIEDFQGDRVQDKGAHTAGHARVQNDFFAPSSTATSRDRRISVRDARRRLSVRSADAYYNPRPRGKVNVGLFGLTWIIKIPPAMKTMATMRLGVMGSFKKSPLNTTPAMGMMNTKACRVDAP